MVILEKESRKINISKLRAILLLEANFNVLNKIIFNTRILPTLERNKLISHKIIDGKHGKSSIQIVINKKMISDISNQKSFLSSY